MPDIEKVINSLDEIMHYDGDQMFYNDIFIRGIVENAIDLLKERKAVKPVRDKETGRIWLCGNCGTYVGFEDNDPHDPNEFDKFCRECGRPVLWEGR